MYDGHLSRYSLPIQVEQVDLFPSVLQLHFQGSPRVTSIKKYLNIHSLTKPEKAL